MKRDLLYSLLGHLAVTFAGAFLSSLLVEPVPAFETIKVDLTTLPAPAIERPTAQREPERPTPPPEEKLPAPRIEADPAPAEPAREEPALRPPEPELPRKPAPEKPKPEPPPATEPERPPRKESPPPAEPSVPAPRSEASPEDLGRGASVQATASEGVEDSYLRLVQQKIGRRWQPIPALAGGRSNVAVVVSFRIAGSGEVFDVKVTDGSGLPLFDQRARASVLDSSPLPRPPARFGADGLRINFHFVYNP